MAGRLREKYIYKRGAECKGMYKCQYFMAKRLKEKMKQVIN